MKTIGGAIKVIFLDIDGVLISGEFIASLPDEKRVGVIDVLDPVAVRRLNRIVVQTGAEVVVSSTWRIRRTRTQLCDVLREAGFVGTVRGMTPVLSRGRGLEIQSWLTDARLYGVEVETFVTLDDDSADMMPVSDRLVKTPFKSGLLDEHADRAIEMLSTPMPLVVPAT